MELVVVLLLVALMAALLVHTLADRREAVRVPARVSRPRMMRRR